MNNSAASPFTKDFTIIQHSLKLECSKLLESTPLLAISVPYVDDKSELTNVYSDFFKEKLIKNCKILKCNYGDTCGDQTTISNLNIEFSNEMSAYPYTLKYK